jgi:hypothetical protein
MAYLTYSEAKHAAAIANLGNRGPQFRVYQVGAWFIIAND